MDDEQQISNPLLTTRDEFEPERKQSGFAVLESAMRRENLVGSVVASGIFDERHAPEEGYNPFQDDAELQSNPVFREHGARFSRTTSAAAKDQLKFRIQREEEDRRVIARGGWLGIAASVGAGFTSPENLLPGLGIASRVRSGAKLGAIAVAASAEAAGAAAISEIGLQSTQLTRTATESAYAVGGSAIIGGLLGGGTKLLSDKLTRRQLGNLVAEEIATGERSTAIVKALPENFDDLPLGEAKRTALLDAIKSADPDLFKLVQGDTPVLGRVVKSLASFTTGSRLTKARAKTARALAKLSPTGILQQQGEILGPTTEAFKRRLQLQAQGVRKEHRSLYHQYKKEGGTLNADQYDAATFDALWRGDTPAAVEGSLEHTWLAASAKNVRVLFDNHLELAIEGGHLTRPKFTSVDPGYAPTTWNVPAIAGARGTEGSLSNFLQSKGVTKAVADEAETSITTGSMSFEVINPQSARFKALSLDKISRRDLAEAGYLKTNVEEVLDSFIASTAADLAITRDWLTNLSPRWRSLIGEVEDLFAEGVEFSVEKAQLVRESIKDLAFAGAYHARLDPNAAKLADDFEALIEQRSALKSLEEMSDDMRFEIEGHRRAAFEQTTANRKTQLKPMIPHWKNIADNRETVQGELFDLLSDVRQAEAEEALSLRAYEAKIKREYAEQAAGLSSARERKQLTAEESSVIKDIENITRGLRNIDPFRDPHSVWSTSERAIRKLLPVSKLGGALFAAFADLGTMVMAAGVGRSVRSLVRGANGAIADMPKSDVARLAWVSETMVDGGRLARQAGLFEDVASNTRGTARVAGFVEKAADVALRGFSWASGLGPWTGALKAASGLAISDKVIADSIMLATGKATNAMTERLAAVGIDTATAKRIADSAQTHGKKDGGFWIANSQAWDRDVREVFETSVLQDIERAILTPSLGDRPRFMSIPFLRLIATFKSFAFSSTNKVAIRSLQRQDAGVVTGALLSMGFGAIGLAAREKLKGNRLSDDPKVWAADAVDRSGLLGIVSDISNTGDQVLNFGGRTALGIEQRAQHDRLQALGGPVAAYLKDAATAANSALDGDLNEGAVRRMLPFQNLFYLRGLFDKLEGGEQR